MILRADINSCEIVDWQPHAGEYNARTLQVELCEEMGKCAMSFATFVLADGTVYESLVKDGKAEIPLFEKPQFVKIGAYSADIEGNELKKRYSPTPCYGYVNPGSYSGSGEEPPVPTPGDYVDLLEQITNLKKGTIKIVDVVNLSTCDSGVYFTNTINYKLALIPQPMTEMMPCKALLTVEKTQFGTHFVWFSEAFFIAGMSNADGKFESDFTRYSLEEINNAIKKSDVETEVFLDETFEDTKIYNANAVNGAFNELVAMLEKLDERLGAINEDYTEALSLIGGAE